MILLLIQDAAWPHHLVNGFVSAIYSPLCTTDGGGQWVLEVPAGSLSLTWWVGATQAG